MRKTLFPLRKACPEEFREKRVFPPSEACPEEFREGKRKPCAPAGDVHSLRKLMTNPHKPVPKNSKGKNSPLRRPVPKNFGRDVPRPCASAEGLFSFPLTKGDVPWPCA